MAGARPQRGECGIPVSDTALAAAVRDQLGPAYDGVDESRRQHYVELLRTVREPDDVALHAERADGGEAKDGVERWTVIVSTADRVGALSIIAGLFTAYGMDIVSADVFTLDFTPPPEQQPRAFIRGRRHQPRPAQRHEPYHKILDIFEVRAPAPSAGLRTGPSAELATGGQDGAPWDRFRTDLAALTAVLGTDGVDAARELVLERVSEAAWQARAVDASLLPIEIELDNEASPDATRLDIRSADTLGFLFEFTNTLSLLGANIERARIRTERQQTRDTFWVTDAHHHKIVDTERLQDLRVAAALIKQFTRLLPLSPNPAQALRQFGALVAQMLGRPDWPAEVRDLESGAVLSTLAELMGVSRFLWEDFLRMQHDNLFPVLVDTPALDRGRTREQLRAELGALLAAAGGHEQRVRALNEFKDREMFRIDLRHITRRVDFVEFSRELSELADVVVEATAVLAHDLLAGRPDAGARHLPWSICALGKFGGLEMGFASDVELIFLYDHAGGESDATTAAAYFEEFVRAFLAILEVHRQGIFEVDLRLRPHGNAGALATSIEGFRTYFSARGAAQQFERMALVKLRPVAGDAALGRRAIEARDAFVYSGRPLDLDNVRHLRARQATELTTPGTVNAKYSAGGVVDIEYYVQAQQIAVGHLDPAVRVTGTLSALDRLVAGGHVEPERAAGLRDAYSFLRRLIDALRVVRGNARDLTIPPPDSREFAYLARRLEYEAPGELAAAIGRAMDAARGVWEIISG